MPFDQPSSLSADEVYSVVAFLFYRNGIIKEGDVLDATTVPKIQMPNRNGFFPARPDERDLSGRHRQHHQEGVLREDPDDDPTLQRKGQLMAGAVGQTGEGARLLEKWLAPG